MGPPPNPAPGPTHGCHPTVSEANINREKTPSEGKVMGRNLDLDNCTNKQEVEDEVLVPHFAEILPEPSTY